MRARRRPPARCLPKASAQAFALSSPQPKLLNRPSLRSGRRRIPFTSSQYPILGYYAQAASFIHMNANINRAIGKGLRGKRTELNLTQEQLAERLGKIQSYVSKTEQGERSLHVAEVFSYADALELQWQDLMLDVKVWIGMYEEGNPGGGSQEQNQDLGQE